jgi:hypothetical protein
MYSVRYDYFLWLIPYTVDTVVDTVFNQKNISSFSASFRSGLHTQKEYTGMRAEIARNTLFLCRNATPL